MTSIAEINKERVRAFFKTLEAEDPKAVSEMFAEDGIHLNPYHCGVFPEGAKGPQGVYDYWAPTFGLFDGMSFPIHEIYAMEGGEGVFVRYSGRIKLKDDAGWYENDYYSTFKFNGQGKITEYVEIFNPVTAARGFGLLGKLVTSPRQ
ncbi:nuclear transport factor 2 family protein [Ferrimonas sp. YFM]|uniref:nuclear transport factor 2 family protein n=1 Tax=Ferrimonas sp. YFM TaxID=3028878 RepID=UPI002573660A|nr:nuclear transport factor 2 family protein [Ferrimonas sp. YFM]BDY05053.1 hypothetical protein F0521_20940 [Ferrimonas sp. YFM]